MRRFLGTAMLFGMTLGWWGFVYPELCLIPEESEQEQTNEMTEEKEQKYVIVLQSGTDDEQTGQEVICIKSRLYEYICQYKETAHE